MNVRRRMCVSVSLKMFLASCGGVALLWPASALRAQNPEAFHPALQASTQATSKPNLAGAWKLNRDQSDDPREKMRQAMGGGGGSGEGHGGGGWHQGSGDREGRGQGGGMMSEYSQLTIEQTDSATKVVGASGRVLAISPAENSGSTNEPGVQTPPEGKWQGNQFVVVTQGMRGGTTTRTYELSSEGKQLYVTTKMENERFSQPVTFRLVFDAAKSGGDGSK